MDSALMQGQVIPHSFNAGYIILSYCVSFVGCWTSLNLLHWRTSRRGYYNWYLLLGAAASMGAVAIWSMHFIGNRALIMAQGERHLQIQYNAGFTAGSFFLPICVLGIAFYLLGFSEKVNITQVIVVGFLTGAAVCGMHYFGQGGISNYLASYDWQYVLGSAFIAITAATLALGVFFYLNATWTDNWMKRALCAAVLAVSVSGMHWVATVGTTYRLKEGRRKANGLTRQATVVVVLCLAMGCCIALLSFAFFAQRVKNRSARQAQEVVLASVVFDDEGKLMVTPEGRLPCRMIAKTSMERNFDEIFDTNHPVFTWVYRASHYWPAVTHLIPGFKAHLGVMRHGNTSQAGLPTVPSDETNLDNLEEEADFGTRFKELFCVAASELAESVHEPLKDLGVLFDSIMLSGTIGKPRKWRIFSRPMMINPLRNAEYGQMLPTFGRGQFLFLVRQANKRGAEKLQAAGFRFANLAYIMPLLAQSMEVTTAELSGTLLKIQSSLTNPSILEPGVHLACYALRPKFRGGWDILINKKKRNLLPSVQLSSKDLRPWQLDILLKLDNMTVRDCYLYLQHRASDAPEPEKDFLFLVDQKIESLTRQIDHPLFENARFLAHPYLIPCRSLSGSSHRAKATVMMFRVIADANLSSPLNGRLEFGSSRLFRAQQHVFPGSPDHGAFARQVHLEFAGLAEARTQATAEARAEAGPEMNSRSPTASEHSTLPDLSRSSVASLPIKSPVEEYGNRRLPFSASETKAGKLVPGNKRPGKGPKVRQLFGGIHVQNEISLAVREVDQGQETEEGLELCDLGVHSEVSVAPTEIDNFADELLMLLIEERRRQYVKGPSA
ncbi:MAG: hypothetical protein LQ344_008155 [Seirophora lacunosa]|nr:MAG: hypothetical protein LQ344_008155 [Seirophora lacunosa]